MLLILLRTVFLFLLLSSVAPAHEEHGGCRIGDYGCLHDRQHHWYQSGEPRGGQVDEKGNVKMGPLMRPHDPTIRCCDGDCRPTKARLQGDQWQAMIDGEWEPIPEDRIKRNVVSPDGMAHVCAERRPADRPPVIHCFVQPEGDS